MINIKYAKGLDLRCYGNEFVTITHPYRPHKLAVHCSDGPCRAGTRSNARIPDVILLAALLDRSHLRIMIHVLVQNLVHVIDHWELFLLISAIKFMRAVEMAAWSGLISPDVPFSCGQEADGYETVVARGTDQGGGA